MRDKRNAGLSVLILMCLFLGSGCPLPASASKPVALNDALAIVENDLRASGPVELSDISSVRKDSVRKDKISQEIFTAQCASRKVDPKTKVPIPGTGTPNPLVPVVTGPISMALQGSIQQAPGVTVTGSATPSAALSYTITQAQQQQVTVPITFVSARGLANFYMGQNLANLTNLEKEDKAPFVKQILKNQADLSKIADATIAAYPEDDATCPNDLTSPAPVPPVFSQLN